MKDSGVLARIVEQKEVEVAAQKKEVSLRELQERLKHTLSTRSLKDSLHSGVHVIAEFKRRSPSKGNIHEGAEVTEIVKGYQSAGASAVSVLTDTPFFGGTLQDLEGARRVLSLPILRKDFIVDSYQITESRVWGADIILLIAACLTPSQVQEYTEEAHEIGLEVLLEIHHEDELIHVEKSGVDIVGVNNRNLHTFVTSLEVSERLISMLPSDTPKISESGISSAYDGRRLHAAGYSGFLIGESFMRESSPSEACKRFIEELTYET